MRFSSALSIFVLAIAGCAGADGETKPGWQAGKEGVKDVSSGTEAEKLFPMIDGHIYHYKTELLGEGPAAGSGALMMKMHRSSSTAGELRRPAGTQRFEYTPAGIATTTKAGAPAFLLKMPLDPANRWVGPHGGQTRVAATGITATTQAGTFKDCVSTLEERGGDTPMRVSTTLCPGVGIVALEVQSGAAVERAELVYYGPPVDIGPEGLKRVE
ncbi:MAG: hypothetical protein HOV80_21955 [Polyangiaceae bacterium]|nr:hypothetical protein [Polyangiaceae bacterium]